MTERMPGPKEKIPETPLSVNRFLARQEKHPFLSRVRGAALYLGLGLGISAGLTAAASFGAPLLPVALYFGTPTLLKAGAFKLGATLLTGQAVTAVRGNVGYNRAKRLHQEQNEATPLEGRSRFLKKEHAFSALFSMIGFGISEYFKDYIRHASDWVALHVGVLDNARTAEVDARAKLFSTKSLLSSERYNALYDALDAMRLADEAIRTKFGKNVPPQLVETLADMYKNIGELIDPVVKMDVMEKALKPMLKELEALPK